MSALGFYENLDSPHDLACWEQRREARGRLAATCPGVKLTVLDDVLGNTAEADRRFVHFDFLVRPDGGYEVYVTTPGRLTRYHSVSVPGSNRRDVRWQKEAEYKAPWVGPFYVVADGDDRHFVAGPGRVYSTPRNAKPGDALTETWKGSPVLALVHDTEAGRSYGFTKDQFFAITREVRPRSHWLPDLRGRTADEALETVAKCAKVIRGQAVAGPVLFERRVRSPLAVLNSHK